VGGVAGADVIALAAEGIEVRLVIAGISGKPAGVAEVELETILRARRSAFSDVQLLTAVAAIGFGARTERVC